jgi:hypothetical protein
MDLGTSGELAKIIGIFRYENPIFLHAPCEHHVIGLL